MTEDEILEIGLALDALSLGSVTAFNVGVNLRAKQLERAARRKR